MEVASIDEEGGVAVADGNEALQILPVRDIRTVGGGEDGIDGAVEGRDGKILEE